MKIGKYKSKIKKRNTDNKELKMISNPEIIELIIEMDKTDKSICKILETSINLMMDLKNKVSELEKKVGSLTIKNNK